MREYFLSGGKGGEEELTEAVWKILEGYRKGIRIGLGLDSDGLLWAGEGDSALTWMDSRVHGNAVTPRVGKPVEVEALWLNALSFALTLGKHPDPELKKLLERGVKSFRDRFWFKEGGYLYDVVDADRFPHSVDSRFRPNQLFAVGGLPLTLVTADQARQVLEKVERRLAVPYGLRTLAPEEPGYQPHYRGGAQEREATYHQGSAWPWLLGPFVEAWLKCHRGRPQGKNRGEEKIHGAAVGTHAPFGFDPCARAFRRGGSLPFRRLSLPSLVAGRVDPPGKNPFDPVLG